MNKFSINDCKIIWRVKFDVPKSEKEAIKADLKSMSNLIEEAMNYTRNKILKEKRDTMIRFWLNENIGDDYFVEIIYEPSFDAWIFSITNANAENVVGEIVSEKWRIAQTITDEDEEIEEDTF